MRYVSAAVVCLTLGLIAAVAFLNNATPTVSAGEDDPLFGFFNTTLGGSATFWTTTGSTGTVDDADLNIVSFGSAVAQAKPSAPAGSKVNLRYNITATPNLVTTQSQWQMAMRFRDNGQDARVVAKLRRYNNSNGQIDTLMSMNSDNYTQQNGYQLQVQTINASFDFNFGLYAYFIDVTLIKSGNAGKPAVGFLGIAGG